MPDVCDPFQDVSGDIFDPMKGKYNAVMYSVF